MGNSQGKETGGTSRHWSDPNAQRDASGQGTVYASRGNRSSQNNLSSIFSSSSHREREREGPQDEAALAARRETKAEREARRIEKEKLARLRERERSMREESVDGGYLVTQGVYTGIEDFNKSIVRSLMIDRRLAPFWPGLQYRSDSWAEHQLIAAVHGHPVPGADEPPAQTPHWPPADGPQYIDAGVGPSTSQSSANVTPPAQTISSSPPLASGSLLKGRTKGLASLTMPKGASSTDLTQRETTLPAEPTINGQRLEVYLYKDAAECPICFLDYPPYLNRTRCCDQAICSECFVQIKRPDPHPPEHHDDPNNPTAQAQMTQEREQELGEITLVSEPAKCPYCGLPEFGVTFEPPPIRRGLVYNSQLSSSPSPLPSPSSPVPASGRKRAASLPATAPSVITTDRVRPEWSNKLATARAHAARRSAAATALHTAAYMMGNNRERRIPLFGRRGASSRNVGNDEAGEGSSAGNENSGNGRGPGEALDIVGLMQAAARGPPGQQRNTGGQSGSSRRHRVEDVEELMMMEAIRLSLAAEEDRRKKEEKERAKEEKRKAKEDKKAQKEAQKAARKASGSSSNLYGLMAGSRSNLTVNSAQPSMISQDSGAGTPAGKGKGVARERSESNPYVGQSTAGASQDAGAQAHLERSRANLQPPADPFAGSGRPSHLRNLSNASSTSSLGNPSPNLSGVNIPRAAGSTENLDTLSATPPTGGAGLEPMVNFRSLMAMIEDEERERADQNTDDVAASKESQNESEKHSDSGNGIGNGATISPNGDPKHHVHVTSGPMANEQAG